MLHMVVDKSLQIQKMEAKIEKLLKIKGENFATEILVIQEELASQDSLEKLSKDMAKLFLINV